MHVGGKPALAFIFTRENKEEPLVAVRGCRLALQSIAELVHSSILP